MPLLVLLLWGTTAQAQIQVHGSATVLGGGCYQLTSNLSGQSGAAYEGTTIDLNTPFDLNFTVNLGGNNANGADGMVFALRSNLVPPNSGNGGSIGISGMTNMLGVEIDTWENPPLSDIAADHIAVISEGSTNHAAITSLAGPVQASAASANIEDNQDHDFRVTWDPASQVLRVYFDCVFRLSYTGDIITDIFNGNANVFWGFIGSTGGATNTQSFCITAPPAAGLGFTNAFSDTTICQGDSVAMDVTFSNTATYDWNNAGSVSDSSTHDPFAFPAASTTYVVTVSDSCVFHTDTVQVNVIPVALLNLGDSFTLCGDDSLVFMANDPSYVSYNWSTGSATNSTVVNTTSTVSVAITDTNGCTVRDSAKVTVYPLPNVELGPSDTVLCNGSSLLYNLGGPGVTLVWEDGSTQPFRFINSPGVYSVTATSNGCTNIDSITVSIATSSAFPGLGNDTVLCQGNSFVLNVGITQGTYLWQDGSTDSTFTITGGGTYWVQASNSCGTYFDTIVVTGITAPQVNLGNDTTLCEGTPLVLDATVPSSTYLWDDGSTNAQRTVTVSGLYAVSVTNSCGADQGEVRISFELPLDPQLGSDRTLCAGEELVLNSGINDSVPQLWSTGDDGTEITVSPTSSSDYWVVGENSCGVFADTVTISVPPRLPVFLGSDTNFCGDQLELNAEVPGGITYLWSDGSSMGTFTAVTSGLYGVTVTDAFGCLTTDEIFLNSVCEPVVEVPNVITPNNDGLNDVLAIDIEGDFDNYEIKIYNRWGRKVFESNDATEAWDGLSGSSEVSDGVYYWVIVLDTPTKDGVSYTGDITVVQ